MQENEYRENEKVLYKTRVKLSLPHNKREEADCVVTEGHVVIEAEEPIKIPLLRIRDCSVDIDYLSASRSTPYAQEPFPATMTLTFLDDLNKKHKLSLEMAPGDLSYFEQAIAEQILEQTGVSLYTEMVSKDTQSEIVVQIPALAREAAWLVLLFGIVMLWVGLAQMTQFWVVALIGLSLVLAGIWLVGMTTKVIFNQLLGYMTVSRGHVPLFLWFLRRKRFSREEARSAFVRSVRRTVNKYGGTVIVYEVRLVARSGKEVKLYEGREGDAADYLVKKILHFAQVADTEVYPCKLNEIRQAKLGSGARFSMRVDEVFQATFVTGALGMVVGGRVEQGAIRDGDDVEIRGRGRRRKAKIFEVDTLKDSGAPGERIRVLIEDVAEDDVRLGDIVEKV